MTDRELWLASENTAKFTVRCICIAILGLPLLIFPGILEAVFLVEEREKAKAKAKQLGLA